MFILNENQVSSSSSTLNDEKSLSKSQTERKMDTRIRNQYFVQFKCCLTPCFNIKENLPCLKKTRRERIMHLNYS